MLKPLNPHRLKHLPDQLAIVSYLSPNFFWFYQAVGEYLSRTFQIPVQVKQSWTDPFAGLLDANFDLAFVCGLPLSQVCHTAPNRLQAIAAPVMQAERYQNCPIYFSDLVVNISSSVTQLFQLANKRFCFNDPGSNSGYNLMRYRLMQASCPIPFFSEVLQSGSHQQSIRWIMEHKADCAAIDSIVLEQELRQAEQFESQLECQSGYQSGCQSEPQLRVIESLGPNPMPPIVISHRLEPFLESLQFALLHPDPKLSSQMQQARVRRFAAVQTSDYEVIYQIYEKTYRSEYAVIR